MARCRLGPWVDSCTGNPRDVALGIAVRVDRPQNFPVVVFASNSERDRHRAEICILTERQLGDEAVDDEFLRRKLLRVFLRCSLIGLPLKNSRISREDRGHQGEAGVGRLEY
jgi:hypothetical protein